MPTSFLELTHAMLVSHFRLFSLELHLDFCSAISSCFQFPSDPWETKCKDRLDISSLAATSIDHCYVFRVDSANTFEPLCKYLYLCVVSKTKHTIYSNIGYSISRRVHAEFPAVHTAKRFHLLVLQNLITNIFGNHPLVRDKIFLSWPAKPANLWMFSLKHAQIKQRVRFISL